MLKKTENPLPQNDKLKTNRKKITDFSVCKTVSTVFYVPMWLKNNLNHIGT